MSAEVPVATRRGEALDFAVRAELTEWMDEPCSYQEFRACLVSLRRSNRLTFNYRPTMQWLERFCAVRRPLHVVDVGSGGGDMLRRVERWAGRRGVPVVLTGIDLNPYAERAAREFTPVRSRIRWVTGDVFTDGLEPPDLVISSLVTHHLPEPEIVRLLRWMEGAATTGWFVNDLSRSAVPYHFYRVFARVMRFHRFVRHDGPVSIRRAFRREDWARMLAAAGLAGVAEVYGVRPARLCVSRVKRDE